MDLEAAKLIFGAALEKPVSERDRFLENACAGDADLLCAVRGILGKHLAGVETSENEPSSAGVGKARVPTQLGQFRIVREIGRGGMGVVYEAIQDHPARTIALKVVSSW